MTTHELKSWPDFFEPIASGTRTFDLRRNDRKYRVGDGVRLREYDDRAGKYTGRETRRIIVEVLDGIGGGCITPMQGLMRGYCILGLAEMKTADATIAEK